MVDVIVVGSGPSGVAVAQRLATLGFECVILEAGAVHDGEMPFEDRSRFRSVTGPLLGVDEGAWAHEYRGSDGPWLRVRAGGGRSLFWGGWAIAPDEQNLIDAELFGRPWPLDIGELLAAVAQAEDFMGVVEGELEAPFRAITTKLGIEVRPKRATIAPGAIRPATAVDWLDGPQVIGDAVALRVLQHPDGRARGVEYFDVKSGETRALEARAVVLSASPIETTRILLTSELQGTTAGFGEVGRGLVDHRVASYFVILPEPPPSMAEPGVLERAAYVPRFVNMGRTPERDYRGGFSLEVRGPLAMNRLGSDALEGLGLTPEQVPHHSYMLVHAIGESAPVAGRFVHLSRDRRDALGRPIPIIEQVMGPEEPARIRDMCEAAEAVATAIALPNSRVVPFGDPLGGGAIAHESGTARMDGEAEGSVTDAHGQVWNVAGLYVADASVMPTGLDRHPTLTIVALALRTADAIAARL